MNYRELIKKLRRLDCKFKRQGKGSHEIWINNKNGVEASIPNWGAKELRTGAVRTILRELEINPEEFRKI